MTKNHLIVLAAASIPFAISASTFALVAGQPVALPTEVPGVVARSQDLGPTNPGFRLHLAVSMPYADLAGMEAFVESVSDPASPSYRQFLTPEQIGARFGLAENKVQSVVDYLKNAGLNVTLVGKNRLSVLADGTVAQVEKAFGTSIHEFQALQKGEPGNSRYYSFTTALTLPAEIAPYVIDVEGLESFTAPHRLILTPTQTRTLYDLAPMYTAGTQGQGRTVGVSNWDGYRLSNVPLYYSHFGLPTPAGGVGSNVTVVTIGGGSGGGTEGAEGDLDIQMVLGMAPLCNLRIYDGGSTGLIGVLTQEVNDNAADIITESYGWNLNTSGANSAHNLHLSMSGQGITYMTASGDNGTSIEPYSYPDYEPEVLSVGGTVATANGSGTRTSEVGWSGSGGGWSTKGVAFNVRPSWQTGTNVPTNVNRRLVPDVALNASGSGGAYSFYYQGVLSGGAAGTSFASPVFAGALAVAEQKIIALGGLPPNSAGKQRFGRIQNLFYSQNGRSDVWHDITSGNNGTLPDGSGTGAAGPAWDYCTGWGAIDFNGFVNAYVPPPPPAPVLSGNGSNSVIDTQPNGNSNGAIDPGEDALEIRAKVINTGTLQASGIVGTLASLTPGVTVTTPVADYPNLNVNGYAGPTTPYIISVSPDFVCGNPVNLRLSIACAQLSTSFTYNFSFTTGPNCPPPLGACDADLNQDGNIDQGDIDYLINVVAGGSNPTAVDADFNRDGNVDQGDVDALINVVAGGTCP